MLFTTLPRMIGSRDVMLAEKMFAHPLVRGARYNTGMGRWNNPKDLLSVLSQMAESQGKQFWLDLKMGQLRITKWGFARYDNIELNHTILELQLPARIYFRGGFASEIVDFKDNLIVVDPIPKDAVGAGQAVVIISDHLVLDQRLAASDYEYLHAAAELGLTRFMLSFVESLEDITAVLNVLGNYKEYPIERVECMLKIESCSGVEFCKTTNPALLEGCRFMAARDDLKIALGFNEARYGNALVDIIHTDPNAFCASRIFESLPQGGHITWGDIQDVIRMHKLGYKNFMFSDTISLDYFDQAIECWEGIQPLLV